MRAARTARRAATEASAVTNPITATGAIAASARTAKAGAVDAAAASVAVATNATGRGLKVTGCRLIVPKASVLNVVPNSPTKPAHLRSS